jgi:hypothetical protein
MHAIQDENRKQLDLTSQTKHMSVSRYNPHSMWILGVYRRSDTVWKLTVTPPDIASAPGAHGGRTGGIAGSLTCVGVRHARIQGRAVCTGRA